MIKQLQLSPLVTKAILYILCMLGTAVLLSVALKTNNPEQPLKLTHRTQVEGPFESSNTTSRFALVESIVNQGTFFFDEDLARFGVPDVVESNGKFYSSFTPGVSFVAVPFYLLGKNFGVPEFTTFLSTILFAICNGVALYLLGKKIGASTPAAVLGSAVFLFATNALPYSATLTQHHLSTLIITLSVLNALGRRTVLNNILFGAYCGIGFLFDFPNLFMLFPVGVYILLRHFTIEDSVRKFSIQFKTIAVVIALGLVPFLAVFGWYNIQLTGSPMGFAQFSARTNYFDTAEKKARDLEAAEHVDPYQPTLPFNTRQQLDGIYILLFSNERSWLWYSPVVLLGIFGLIALYKKYPHAAVLFTAIIGTNIILYSMFGDPWGGWSFGPRYLIPSAALLSVAVGYAVSRFRRNIFFMLLFLIAVTYSVAISAASAVSTTAIPPKQESESLINYIPYTYEYNFSLLESGQTYSIVYLTMMKQFTTPYNFYLVYTAILCAVIYGLSTVAILKKEK